MSRYIFIYEYRGGTYIEQVDADNLSLALIIWADTLSTKVFSKNKKDLIKKDVLNVAFAPTPVKSVDNVWCVTYLTGCYFLLLNIVKTGFERDIYTVG